MDGSFSEGLLFLPLHLAGFEVHAGPAAFVRVAIQVAFMQDDAAVVVHHVGVGIDVAHRVVGTDLDGLAADTVTSGDEDLPGAEDGCRDDGGLAGELGAPEHVPVGGVDSGDAFHGELDDLLCAVVLHGDGGGVLRCVHPVLGLPGFGSGFLVKGRQCALRSTGGDDHEITHDERTLAVAPSGHLAAEIGHVRTPQFLAGGGLKTDEDAFSAQRIHFAIIHRRCGARAVAPAVGEQRPGLGGPFLFPRLRIDGDDILHGVTSTHGVNRAADDGEARVAEPGVFIEPDPLRPVCGPGFEQISLRGDVAAIWSAKGGPVGG